MSIYISSSGTLSAEELERFSRNIAAFLAENGIHLAAVVTGKSPLVCAAVKACCMAHVCCIPESPPLTAVSLQLRRIFQHPLTGYTPPELPALQKA